MSDANNVVNRKVQKDEDESAHKDKPSSDQS